MFHSSRSREKGQAGRLPYFDSIDPSAFLFFVRVTGVEHDSVARLERRLQTDDNLVPLDARHFAEINAAFFAEPRVDQLLVVDAAEPAGVEPARKGHFQIVLRVVSCGMRVGRCWFFVDPRSSLSIPRYGVVECLAVDPRDVG